MERYKILEELGNGTCGSVYKALNIGTSEIVAVKKMKRKFYYWEECVNLREVKSLRKLTHPNVIKLMEIVRENNELFFIFEYMEHNLYQIMKERQKSFSEEEIRGLMTQVLQGLAYVHKNGYFHRDLKPENLLVTNNTIKIADFGLARELSSMPPFTDYVSTRWYRAPEVLLQSSSYTPAIDMWAVGAILAELFTSCPIFPGQSEIDQLYKICCVLGAPDWNTFPEARNIARLVDISYSEIMPANLSDVIPNASLEAIDLVKQLCSWDPLKRPTADQCLQHPFFHVGKWIPHPPGDLLQLRPSNYGSKPNLELNLWDYGTARDDCFLGLTLAVNPSASNLDRVNKSQGTGEDIMLCSGVHDQSQQSDMWAVGAILAELFTSCPIFPGQSEIDQLYKICCVLGAPDWNTFPEARNIARLVDISYSEIMPANLSDVIPNASLEAIDLVKQLCSWDPLKRPTADQCLQHPFFHVGKWIPHPPGDLLQLRPSNYGSKPNLELNLWDYGTARDDCFLGLTLAVNPSASNLDRVNKSQGTGEDIMLCSGVHDQSQQSVFWSLFPSDHHGITAPVDPSLSLSFSSIAHSTIGVAAQSSGFGMPSLQTSILDCPLLAMSSPFQQGQYL